MPGAHPTAIVSSEARIADSATIGPYAIIDGPVRVGAGSSIGAHAMLLGRTTIGKNTRVYASCVLGEEPQDKKFAGEDAELVVGDNNTIREFCTISRGSRASGRTVVGDGNWIMAYTHIAHDCVIGDDIIMSNNTTLAGHVEVGDGAVLGGLTLAHQFCRIGRCAFTGRVTALVKDLAPFTMATGMPARTSGLNRVGLERRGFSAELVAALARCYKMLVRKSLPRDPAALEQLAARHPEVAELIAFVESSERGVTR